MFDDPTLIFLPLIVVFILIPYIFPKGSKLELSFKLPNMQFLNKKKVEEKIAEIDKELEKVVSSDTREKIVKIDEAVEEASKKFEIKEELLNEMQTEERKENAENESESSLPQIPPLTLDMNMEDVEKEISLDGLEDKKEEEQKIDFEDKDKLLEELTKEVSKEEEKNTVDLMRGLKVDFNASQLESELKEMLMRLKNYER